MKRFNAHVASGDFDGVAAGSAVSGNTLFLGSNTQKVSALSALVSVEAETDTFTIESRWQVSNDESTWYTVVHGSQNPSATVLQTGTTADEAEISRVIPGPPSEALGGYQFARLQLVAGGTTGATVDTYEIGYTYRVPRGQARRN